MYDDDFTVYPPFKCIAVSLLPNAPFPLSTAQTTQNPLIKEKPSN